MDWLHTFYHIKVGKEVESGDRIGIVKKKTNTYIDIIWNSGKVRHYRPGIIPPSLYEEIKQLHKTHTTKQISIQTGFSISAINNVLYRRGKRKGKKNKRWTKEEDQYIKDNYTRIPSEEIAQRLKVPVSKVYNRANILGILKNEIWLDPERLAFVILYNSGYSLSDIPRILKKSKESVSSLMDRLIKEGEISRIRTGKKILSEDTMRWLIDYLLNNTI